LKTVDAPPLVPGLEPETRADSSARRRRWHHYLILEPSRSAFRGAAASGAWRIGCGTCNRRSPIISGRRCVT
jgi:hypothetical protein